MQLLALVKGEVRGPDPLLVRVQRHTVLGNVLDAEGADDWRRLRTSLVRIAEEGRGVILYLHGEVDLACELDERDCAPNPDARGAILRDYGIGAQVLRDLGIQRMRLLTSEPRRIAGLEGYGLEVTEQIPLDT
jgi:3,4-dihydroxy 2-butanone 4-phosphate synthase/GTP cyclohydrolase II